VNVRDWWPWKPSSEVKAFVADLNTVAYSSYTNQRLWLRTGHAILVAILWALLTDNVDRLDDALNFVLMWCSFLTGKSVITAGRDAVKRNTAEKYIAAKGIADAKVAAAQLTATERPGARAPAPIGMDNSRIDDERGD
jgi:hypothetical protein